ncbi:hypothetical protein BKP45_01030 [Anaerobacillus alkalidiazotrophicus]|uniref:Bacterial Pleckstrin homology domain-containing protein n=2 Tax=Anaerobacillus TaxID=704093 RepID=A0A1S2M9U8_9BACI|nr:MULTISPECIES: hypothetical protein [Anaerobacillus]OIJ12010.1 hypothetical protein BKP37_14620 [Anaerobacillus alkalilacustris]OIJ21394.1 hypothetical protein BKP45_01030 [Anaerobacillus alkalidiazotrophicus]
MSLILKQPYVKVFREINGIEQKYIENVYYLYLYETKIVSPYKTYKLKDVFDVSYRKTSSNKYGTLYLHTNEGVFPFQVHSSPELFIQSVKQLQQY